MTATAARRGRGRGRLRLLSLLVLVVLVAATLGAFAVSRRVVGGEEQPLLAERAGEVGVLLVTSIGTAGLSRRVGGPIGASPDPATVVLFAQNTGRLVRGHTKTVGAAVNDGGGFAVVAAAGDGPPRKRAASSKEAR